MKSFMFDSMGASPDRLRKNLDNYSSKDSSFNKGRLLHKSLNNPNSQDRAIAIVTKLRANRNPENKKTLFALCMYRRADRLENERNTVVGNSVYTLGVDYQSVLGMIRKDVDRRIGEDLKVIVGKARTAKSVYKLPGYTLFSNSHPNQRGRDLWKLAKKVKEKPDKFFKEYGPPLREAQEALAEITWQMWFFSNVNDIYKHKGKANAQAWADKVFKQASLTEEKKNLFWQEAFKSARKHEKERKEQFQKIVKIAKVVGKIALDVAKVIPGVGDAVKTAENAVKQIPGVKEALDLADKVKNTIKDAKAIGDVVKIEKLKDLGNNVKVMEALNIDSVIKDKIVNTVEKTKILQSANILNVAEKIAPEQVQTAMKLVKAAQELDPSAIKQIKSLKKLANAGLYEAQKALQSINVAIKIQVTAKDNALSQYRMWQYW